MEFAVRGTEHGAWRRRIGEGRLESGEGFQILNTGLGIGELGTRNYILS